MNNEPLTITDYISDQLNSIIRNPTILDPRYSYLDSNGDSGIMAVTTSHYNELKGLVKKCLDIFDELNYSDKEIENIREEFKNYE